MIRAALVVLAAAAVCVTAGAAQPTPWKTVTVRKSSGGVTAVMTVERRKTKYDAPVSRNLHLLVTVDGKTVFDQSLCTPLRCGVLAQQTLSLHALSGGTPDAVLDYFTGGAHCCFWSLIVAPTGKKIVHDWGDPGYRVVRYEGVPQLVSADDRFAYDFTAFAASGMPVQVWAITPDGSLGRPDALVNVTQDRLDLVKKDAAQWWKAYTSERGKPDGDVRGVLAAWCADQYRLGRKADCDAELAKALRKGWIKGVPDWPSNARYIAVLHKDLAEWGYPRIPDGRLKVVIGGASGYVGKALAASLTGDGHAVIEVSRKAGGVTWASVASAVDGADAVVNLAGTSIGGPRWTTGRKEAIRSSRVDTNRALADAIEAAGQKPAVFVTASGIDYYGDSGDAVVDEGSPPGDSFLARVCVEWEAAARTSVRSVAVRTALVVGPGAQPIRLMAFPFRLFVGGSVGSGRQWFPWIALDDLVRVYRLAIDGGLEGPVNAVAPEQIRQRDAARDFGAVLGRPALLPTPAFALRLLLGEEADLLLHGQHAVSRKLDDFEFGYRGLRASLEHALG